MATIVIITHKHDRFAKNRGFFRGQPVSSYFLFDIAEVLRSRGHRIVTQAGVDASTTGDAAILHVDLTFTPAEYLDYARQFPMCMNAAVADISKKATSGAILKDSDPWDGPVIVKSNFNCRGAGERQKNRAAMFRGRPKPYPDIVKFEKYAVYETIRSVPDKLLRDDSVVVEKFLAEREAGNEYATRFWTFCGPEERCTRWIGADPIVKGESAIRDEPCPVPDELRAIRARLGVDYGKFDFVVTEEGPVLVDVNKTLGRPDRLASVLKPEALRMADGFEAWMRQHPSGGHHA